MNSNRVMWGIVSLVVLTTVAVTIGTIGSQSQEKMAYDTQTTPPSNQVEDLSKYPIAVYDAPEFMEGAQSPERKLKNKRYDMTLPVVKNPHPETIKIMGSDVEPEVPAIPFAESQFIIIGRIQSSKAFLSNERKGIYSEYVAVIEKILKDDSRRKVREGSLVSMDRAGGVVQYPNGQKIRYQIDWQDLPDPSGRYLFFLANTDSENPNYKILTAYKLTEGKVTALDRDSAFRESNGKGELEFISLVTKKN